MSDSQRVVRQWLETELAFGVAEVPVKRGAASRKTPAPPAPVERAASTPRDVERLVAPLRQPPPSAPPRTASPSLQSASARADVPAAARPAPPPSPIENRKSKIEIPPSPAGLITALPPLTHTEKEQALERLRQLTEEHCREFIDHIATRIVFGEGDIDAPLMFVGEGPGAEEDRTGRPFVGRSGQLLDKMIVAMGFARGQVYIANVVKLRCAAPDEAAGGRLKDRPPTTEEAARGLPILHQQIAIIRPKVIVTLGAPAVRHLTGNMQGVTKIRGTWLDYRGIPVMPTYHPSFLLRAYTPENRRKVWEDLKLAMEKIKS